MANSDLVHRGMKCAIDNCGYIQLSTDDSKWELVNAADATVNGKPTQFKVRKNGLLRGWSWIDNRSYFLCPIHSAKRFEGFEALLDPR